MFRRYFGFIPLLAFLLIFTACGGKSETADGSKVMTDGSAKITFLELGSTTCIPCKKMQPVMKSIETRYAGQVKVIFHDVMKERSKSQEFGIKLIPTQVFLDASGKELMRHEGFFPEEDIDKFLKTQGLMPKS
jgi:thioredoxin 1